MKKTIRRIAIQFTFQFISFLTISVVVIALLLFSLIDYINREEMKQYFIPYALESIHDEPSIGMDNKLTLTLFWQEELTKRDIWLQLIDRNGHVLDSFNTPSDLPKSYQLDELVQMQQTNKFKNYVILTQFERFSDQYIYVLGYFDRRHLLKTWAEFAPNGHFPDAQVKQLETKLISSQATLQIIDRNGETVKTFGEKRNEKDYSNVEYLQQQQGPDLTIFHDTKTDYLWILDQSSTMAYDWNNSFSRKVLKAVTIIGGIIIILGALFSLWHAYRYGQPLLLFIKWLEMLGQGKYDKFLSDSEQRKIRNRKNNVKFRYRLYEAVILSFYNMTKKLQKAEKEQAKLDRTREEWMTGISHDLRTPLSSVHGYGHLLESGEYEWSKEELQEIGKTIREKGDYMLQLVQDFSLAFQLKNNVLPLKKEMVNLVEFTQHIVLRHANDITLKDYSFSFAQSINKPIYIEIDVKLFERMLNNLLLNACYHNPAQTKIEVEIKLQQEIAKIVIKDNGVGMSKEVIDHLFTRYYRGTNTDRAIEGSGLGLNIAKGILEAHGGDISVISKLNQGTVITIKIPC